MSEFLGRMLKEEIALNGETLQLVTKSLRSLTRAERRLLYGELRGTLTRVENALKEAWEKADEEERARWLEFTAESIVEKGGDRDFLDKIATRLIGSLKVYHRVQKLSDERGIVLKVSASQGGCTVILVAITVILGLALIMLNSR